MIYKLGRKPRRWDHRRLQLSKYLDIGKLPPTPPIVRYSPAVLRAGGYRMLLNNLLGCCVPAGIFHLFMQMAANAGRPMPAPSDADVIALYSAIGGYVLGDPSTDNGCDMLTALNYARNTGISVGGVIHKVGAFVEINLADPDEFAAATWLFGGTFNAANMPAAVQGASSWCNVPANLSGDWEPGSWGGHCFDTADATLLTIAAKTRGFWACLKQLFKAQPDGTQYDMVTWGALIPTDTSFIRAFCDECYAVIAADWLEDNGKCPAGFDVATLTDDLAVVSA
jgi:hypothetical protein